MLVNVQKLNEECRNAFNALQPITGLKTGKRGVTLLAEKMKENGVHVRVEKKTVTIEYSELSLFCRALTHLTESWNETPVCKIRAVMLDQSRNGVMNVPTLVDFARRAALLGYNRIMLYLEDIYEVESEPYFGAMRGRYTAGEIAEAERVCETLGIELTPCIQTLAHFNAPFHWWKYAERIVDCDDILLMDNEESYAFLSHLIEAVSKLFKTRNIHVGMDEAFRMCQGKYRSLYGECDSAEVFFRHLEWVRKKCEEYGLEIAVWSDMVYRSATGSTYGQPIEKYIENKYEISDKIALTYWEYGCTDEAEYLRVLNEHKKLGANEIRFAGTALGHAGIVPDNANAWRTAFPAIAACQKAGVQDITVTLWGDDGQECSRFALIPSLVLWAQLLCGGDTDENALAKKCKSCFQAEIKDFFAIDDIWKTRKDVRFHTAHKYLLYNDPLLGLFDSLDGGGVYPEHYARVAKEMRNIAKRKTRYKALFNTYACLCHALEVKSDLGKRVRQAYQARDKKKLREIVRSVPQIKKRITAYRDAHYALWRQENKAFGFETIDVRIGALLRRMDTLSERLRAYLSGKEKNIEELEEMPPDYTGRAETETGMSAWKYIPTTGVL